MAKATQSIHSKQNSDYLQRHLGPSEPELPAMLQRIGVESLSELIEKTIPSSIRLEKEIKLPEALDEYDFLDHIRKLSKKNRIFQNYIGQGYYETITPSVIQRNLFENPGWYTQYTPYQPEISQGRLEALFNYQTMVSDLTGMDIANASLLDEATSAAEAMSMLFRVRDRELQKRGADTFFVSKDVFIQTKAVLRTRAKHLGIPIIEGDAKEVLLHPKADSFFGVLLQYPDATGEISDYRELASKLSEKKIHIAVAADLLSLCLLVPPGEWGADVVVGSVQRFGVPMGFGGPHAGYFATKDEFKRNMAGRLVGLTRDAEGKNAYRLALQTREQHIRREKATSNICTAQALLANMAGMYAVYHGKEGLTKIAKKINKNTCRVKSALERTGYRIKNSAYFDTLTVALPEEKKVVLKEEAESRGLNLCYFYEDEVRLSIGEAVFEESLEKLVEAFVQAAGKQKDFPKKDLLDAFDAGKQEGIPENLLRKGGFLEHQVFLDYHNETLLMRYLNLLAKKDLALDTAMIPLGSCTMKLNPATAMIPVSFFEFSKIHPFAPKDQVEGYIELIKNMEEYLAEITGLAATSLQPNSGAQGEYAGLLAIRAYQKSIGEENRNIALIPASAHGTNPASAALAGMKVVVVKCDDAGNIDVADLNAKCKKYTETLSCLMVTYPSTHGVFEESIVEVCETIHEHGGQVYMDGANLNAQLGFTSPGRIGADVCHLNLHKTFAIPHGGGGPGVGPICVASHLEPFLPNNPLEPYKPLVESKTNPNAKSAVGPVSAANYGSASVLLISYAYIRMLGAEGLKKVTEYAILNANYIKACLEKDYKILYTGKNGFVAHEMILDTRPFKKIGIEVDDIAKRLMDYGFHAPTMSFPVPGTLMVEPTESEPLYELDRFCKAMLGIRKEIEEIESGKADPKNNVLKNAPHTAARLIGAVGNSNSSSKATDAEGTMQKGLPYSPMQAAFPLPGQEAYKFWPSVSRVDHVYGDRNLVCACPPISEYEDA